MEGTGLLVQVGIVDDRKIILDQLVVLPHFVGSETFLPTAKFMEESCKML